MHLRVESRYTNIDEFYDLYERVIVQGDDYLKAARTQARDYLISVNETVNEAFIQQLQVIAYNAGDSITLRPLVNQ